MRVIQIGCKVAAYIFPDFKYGWFADEISSRLPKELDFTIEA